MNYTPTENDLIRWHYNCLDVNYTLEIEEVLQDILEGEKKELQEFYKFQQLEVIPVLAKMMNVGLLVDLEAKDNLYRELSSLLIKIEGMLEELFNYSIPNFTINLKSSAQVKTLFIDLLKVKPVLDRKRKTPSFGSAAMLVYLEQYPQYTPLITLILEYRSIGVFTRTFLSAKVDEDGRMRTSYNVAGTRTYRLSSRKSAFGGGMNLQNVPSKGKIDLKYSLLSDYTEEELETEEEEQVSLLETSTRMSVVELPNCKKLFICEEDETFFDIDLSAADARIIAWVSGCKFLTQLFEDDYADIYLTLAKEYYHDNTLTKKSKGRQIFKAVCHGTNYLGKAPTLAATAGLLIHEVDKVQKFYFDLCPEIPILHKTVQLEVARRGYLENVWGARGWFLDKNDPMLQNKAMAWVGSSPVGILINKGLVNIFKNDKAITPRLQVHDSIAGTFKTADITAPERIKKLCEIPLPFETPRIIPVNIKCSPLSYGDC